MPLEYATLDEVWNTNILEPKMKKKKEKQEKQEKMKKKSDVICQMKTPGSKESVLNDFLNDYQPCMNQNKTREKRLNTYKLMNDVRKDKSFIQNDDIKGVGAGVADNAFQFEDLIQNNHLSLLDKNTQDNFELEYDINDDNNDSFESTIPNVIKDEIDEYTLEDDNLQKSLEYTNEENSESDELDSNHEEPINNRTNVLQKMQKQDFAYLYDILLYIISGILLIFILEQILMLGTLL